MPGHLDPFTHNHRRHTIAHNDQYRAHLSAHAVITPPAADDQPVTVADLLDAAAFLSVAEWNDVYSRARSHVVHSFEQITDALTVKQKADIAIDRLSPEERAEFDRRTSG